MPVTRCITAGRVSSVFVTAQAAPAPIHAPYMSRAAPRALVIGSFFVVALPLAAYVLAGSSGPPTLDSVFAMPLAQAYVVLFGVTHFFLTVTVYLSSPTLSHFGSSRRNTVMFLAAPIVPLTGL